MFIGILSRIEKFKNRIQSIKPDVDVLVLLSGPEPQRSLLEEKILTQAPFIKRNLK